MPSVIERNTESLDRAQGGQSTRNYALIIAGFSAMGIDATDIGPRENVFTYGAWRALGRQVQRGAHGVKIPTRKSIPAKKDEETGEIIRAAGSMPWTATVFHVSQTEPIGA